MKPLLGVARPLAARLASAVQLRTSRPDLSFAQLAATAQLSHDALRGLIADGAVEPWPEVEGARDDEIRRRYADGVGVDRLARTFHLGRETIRAIVAAEPPTIRSVTVPGQCADCACTTYHDGRDFTTDTFGVMVRRQGTCRRGASDAAVVAVLLEDGG